MKKGADTKNRIKELRERIGWSQEQLAEMLEMSRPTYMLIENGQKEPDAATYQKLAKLFNVPAKYLKGEVEWPEDLERAQLFDGLPDDEHIQQVFRTWLDFLDRWANFMQSRFPEVKLPGRQKPPREIDEGYVEDARRCTQLSTRVREHYKLGNMSIPDMYAFLEKNNIMVYRANLGVNSPVSGGFYNHEVLGWCLLVNANMSLGRQKFTLAHEFAHALYHYSLRTIACRDDDHKDPAENFANTFAGEFLVPTKVLRALVNNQEEATPETVFAVSKYFGVSYQMVGYRLRKTGIISFEHYEHLINDFDVYAIAAKLGLGFKEYVRNPKTKNIYPMILLYYTQKAQLTDAEIQDLLGLSLQENITLEDKSPTRLKQVRETNEEWSRVLYDKNGSK